LVASRERGAENTLLGIRQELRRGKDHIIQAKGTLKGAAEGNVGGWGGVRKTGGVFSKKKK